MGVVDVELLALCSVSRLGHWERLDYLEIRRVDAEPEAPLEQMHALRTTRHGTLLYFTAESFEAKWYEYHK